jgi:hypothetical protein
MRIDRIVIAARDYCKVVYVALDEADARIADEGFAGRLE